MGGEGHMLDMIRRLKDGKEASRLRRERRNDKLGRLRRNNDPYLLPDTTPEDGTHHQGFGKEKRKR